MPPHRMMRWGNPSGIALFCTAIQIPEQGSGMMRGMLREHIPHAAVVMDAIGGTTAMLAARLPATLELVAAVL